MAWYDHKQPILSYDNVNEEIEKLSGELDNIAAKITLAKFLRSNIGFCFELMTGGKKLLEQQEILLKSILIRDNSMIVAARGYSKSFLIAVMSIMMPIFYPNSKGCLISSNFRNARRILENADAIIRRKESVLLHQCFLNKLSKVPDQYTLKLDNGSEVFALPLSTGENLRGTRAHWVVVDEGLLISKEIQDNILRPFLTNKQNYEEEMKIREIENELIKEGTLQESDRISFPKNKFIVFSSASYKFQYLYEMFSYYVEQTLNPSKEKDAPTYFVMRASWEAIPQDTSILDTTQIRSAAQAQGENSESFKREYKALFSDSGDGYFNARKLHECTIKSGDFPTTQIKGDKGSEYILAIDPSYSGSKTSDYFAMGVYLINKEERRITLVHTYGKAGGNIKDHYNYLTYLLTFFNIVFVIPDITNGADFISSYNESTVCKEKNIKLDFVECKFDNLSDQEYIEEIKKLKQQYNKITGKIAIGQIFGTHSVTTMNQNLQLMIDKQKIWFASAVGANDEMLNKYKGITLPFSFTDKFDKTYQDIDFLEEQDYWITETKAQIALIEVKTTATGTLQFDLPGNLKRSSSTNPNRPRKDQYTCCLMAGWAAKIYFDMLFNAEDVKPTNNFMPIILR